MCCVETYRYLWRTARRPRKVDVVGCRQEGFGFYTGQTGVCYDAPKTLTLPWYCSQVLLCSSARQPSFPSLRDPCEAHLFSFRVIRVEHGHFAIMNRRFAAFQTMLVRVTYSSTR